MTSKRKHNNFSEPLSVSNKKQDVKVVEEIVVPPFEKKIDWFIHYRNAQQQQLDPQDKPLNRSTGLAAARAFVKCCKFFMERQLLLKSCKEEDRDVCTKLQGDVLEYAIAIESWGRLLPRREIDEVTRKKAGVLAFDKDGADVFDINPYTFHLREARECKNFTTTRVSNAHMAHKAVMLAKHCAANGDLRYGVVVGKPGATATMEEYLDFQLEHLFAVRVDLRVQRCATICIPEISLYDVDLSKIVELMDNEIALLDAVEDEKRRSAWKDHGWVTDDSTRAMTYRMSMEGIERAKHDDDAAIPQTMNEILHTEIHFHVGTGGGKTMGALYHAVRLLLRDDNARVAIVPSTKRLAGQWYESLRRRCTLDGFDLRSGMVQILETRSEEIRMDARVVIMPMHVVTTERLLKADCMFGLTILDESHGYDSHSHVETATDVVVNHSLYREHVMYLAWHCSGVIIALSATPLRTDTSSDPRLIVTQSHHQLQLAGANAKTHVSYMAVSADQEVARVQVMSTIAGVHRDPHAQRVLVMGSSMKDLDACQSILRKLEPDLRIFVRYNVNGGSFEEELPAEDALSQLERFVILTFNCDIVGLDRPCLDTFVNSRAVGSGTRIRRLLQGIGRTQRVFGDKTARIVLCHAEHQMRYLKDVLGGLKFGLGFDTDDTEHFVVFQQHSAVTSPSEHMVSGITRMRNEDEMEDAMTMDYRFADIKLTSQSITEAYEAAARTYEEEQAMKSDLLLQRKQRKDDATLAAHSKEMEIRQEISEAVGGDAEKPWVTVKREMMAALGEKRAKWLLGCIKSMKMGHSPDRVQWLLNNSPAFHHMWRMTHIFPDQARVWDIVEATVRANTNTDHDDNDAETASVVRVNLRRVASTDRTTLGKRSGLVIGSLTGQLCAVQKDDKPKPQFEAMRAIIDRWLVSPTVSLQHPLDIDNAASMRIVTERKKKGGGASGQMLTHVKLECLDRRALSADEIRVLKFLQQIIGTRGKRKPQKYDVCVGWLPQDHLALTSLSSPLGKAVAGYIFRHKKLPQSHNDPVFKSCMNVFKSHAATYKSARKELWKFAVDHHASNAVAKVIMDELVSKFWEKLAPKFIASRP